MSPLERYWTIVVSFNKGGDKYPLNHTVTCLASQPHLAVAKALKDTKKTYGARFRVKEDAVFHIKVLAGRKVETETGSTE